MSPKKLNGRLSEEIVEFLSRQQTPHYVNQLRLHEDLERKRRRVSDARRRTDSSPDNSESSSSSRHERVKCVHNRSNLKLNTTKATRRCCGISREESAAGDDPNCKKGERELTESQKRCKCCACTRCKRRRCVCKRRRQRKCCRPRRRKYRRRQRSCRRRRRACPCRSKRRRRYKR